jgi:hypothetical protein
VIRQAPRIALVIGQIEISGLLHVHQLEPSDLAIDF